MRNESRTHRLPISWSTPQANLPRFLSYSCPSLSLRGDEWQRTLGTKLHRRRIDLIHDTRHLYTRLKTDGLKAMSRGFSGCRQADKICRYKKLRRYCLFQATNNEKPLLLKTWQIMGGSSLLLCYDAVATVDVLIASENDDETCRNSGNSNCRFCMTKIVVSFWDNKQFRPRLLVLANFVLISFLEAP